jgi:acyl-CoA reductase-like NAD-dependent aldehyde dehydrogenase
MKVHEDLYVGGRWSRPFGAGLIDVRHAATEEVIGRVPEGTDGDADRAVRAARGAFEAWAGTPAEERARALERLQQGLAARADEIASTITAEVGMPLALSRTIQAAAPAAVMGSYAALVREHAFEETVGHSVVVQEPTGVVAAITPWNYPLHQAVAKVAPALAAGCTVVLKPSEVAPLSAFILAQVVDAAGLPPGVFNLVTGYGPVVGEALARHPDVDMVSFTGSTAAGRRVGEVAAQTVKRVALELGGKSASVLLDDADFAKAVRSTLNSCFLNSGQTCNALTRMFVPGGRAAEAARLAAEAAGRFVVGDPFAPETKLGPLASAAQRDRVVGYIRKGLDEGARLVTGGAEQGLLREADRVRRRRAGDDDRA